MPQQPPKDWQCFIMNHNGLHIFNAKTERKQFLDKLASNMSPGYRADVNTKRRMSNILEGNFAEVFNSIDGSLPDSTVGGIPVYLGMYGIPQ